MGILHIEHEMVANLLPHFQGISLDLKKKLSATLIPAFLLRLCCSKEKKHTNKFFLPFLLPFFSFLLRKKIKEIPFLEQQNLLTLSELGGIFFFSLQKMLAIF